eukprot:Hpha_TRINITY_DN15551_c4_g1::TRINITY_DN15551_c4_g1_i1::g.106609::m.106609/K19684/CLUAP1, DYF3; clusterin-associated protein 1
MSFRELRQFCEAMRTLGYTRVPIGVDSFRAPNFELVHDVLTWLVSRYDPAGERLAEDDISKARGRVEFLRRAGQLLLDKAHIKLNLKKLYMADGFAVKELLKVASVLRDALITHSVDAEEDDAAAAAVEQLRMNNTRDTRTMATELTEEGYRLHELLTAELEHRDQRNRIVSRPPEMTEIERGLAAARDKVQEEIQALSEACNALQGDEVNLDGKIEAKNSQLERARKRLGECLKFRPAFIEQYEEQEALLQAQYALYLEQCRNLEYLEHELARYNKMEDALMEQQELRLRVMRERLRKEELEVLRGQRMPEDSMFDLETGRGQKQAPDRELENQEHAMARQAEQAIQQAGTNDDRNKRPRAASGRQRPVNDSAKKGKPARATGNMYGNDDDDVSNDDDEDDSDSEGNLSVRGDSTDDSDDSDDSDDDDDDDDDDDEDDDDDDDGDSDDDESEN